MSDSEFSIVERFYSIQGEGYNAGRAAYFIRLAGCDVYCKWCDSKDSWKVSAFNKIAYNELLAGVLQSGARNVVITGGEPSMYDLVEFTSLLKSKGLKLWLETAGTNNITGDFDWVCLSPKRNKLPLESNYILADELKVVVGSEDDLLWAIELSQKVSESCVLYLQPQWEELDNSIELINNFIKENQDWRVSLQTHKFMNIQ